MTNRSDFITRPATLDRWDVVLQVHDPEAPGCSLAIAHGWCERKRGPLWTLVEEFPHSEGPQPVRDWMAAVTDACSLYGPTTIDAIESGLARTFYVQPELWEDDPE